MMKTQLYLLLLIIITSITSCSQSIPVTSPLKGIKTIKESYYSAKIENGDTIVQIPYTPMTIEHYDTLGFLVKKIDLLSRMPRYSFILKGGKFEQSLLKLGNSFQPNEIFSDYVTEKTNDKTDTSYISNYKVIDNQGKEVSITKHTKSPLSTNSTETAKFLIEDSIITKIHGPLIPYHIKKYNDLGVITESVHFNYSKVSHEKYVITEEDENGYPLTVICVTKHYENIPNHNKTKVFDFSNYSSSRESIIVLRYSYTLY